MILHVPLNPGVEERLRRIARQAGTDVTAYVSQLIEHVALTGPLDPVFSAADFDQAIDELFAGDTRKLPCTPLTYPRNDIYFEHD